MNIKKNFLSLVLVSLFLTSISVFNLENIFAEEESYETSVPEISKIESVYSNKEGEFFIYGENFGKDLDKIEVLVVSQKIGEKEEKQELKIENIYSTMLSGKITGNYKNGTLVINKKIGENQFTSSNKKNIDFGLPTLKKVEAPDGILGGKKIIFSGENFKKPVYGVFGSKEIICDKDSETSCEIVIPKDSNFSGKIGIKSYGFETFLDDDVSVEKNAKINVSSYSNNSININVEGFEYGDLRELPKNEADLELKEDNLRSGVDVYIDGQVLDDCTVNTSNKINCSIDKVIFKKGIGYIDFFGIKTSFFSYDLSDTIPYPTTFSKSIKWSTYQNNDREVVEGNRIYLNIGIANFDYNKASESGFGQSTRNDFKLFIGGTEYSADHKDLTLGKNSLELVLSSFPSNMKGDIYFQYGNIISESIPYDLGEYIPELYKVYKGEKENEFVLEGKNLTNFNDLEASLKFGDISLSTTDIKRIILEKKSEANQEITKYETFISKAKEADFIDEDLIASYRSQILVQEGILKDLENGLYERNYNDNNKKEGEILKKSDTQILFKIFDVDEYGKSISKGEYKVYVISNGLNTNALNFFYDPSSSNNIEEAYPVIEKINFTNGAGEPSLIEIKGNFLDRIKELYFTDLKAKIIKKEKNKIIVEIDPASVLRKKGTIIAKLDNLTMTSNLFFYEFIEDKTNKITLNWKKIEKKFNEDGVEIDDQDTEDKKTFNLLLKNTYKDLVFKNLKIKIENLGDSDLPFYNFYLSTAAYGSIKGVYDKKKSTINFINLGDESGFTKKIEVNEDDFYDFNITFDKIKSGKGEMKISVEELNFYDDFSFPKIIPSGKVDFVNTPKFYKSKDNETSFCRELNNKGQFIKCGTEIWSDSDNGEESIFDQEVIKSDFKAPARDESNFCNFIDVLKSQWFSPYLDNLCKRGIIQGYGHTSKTFEPLSTITRAEAVKILLVARNEELDNLKYLVYAFDDVPEGHWAKNILEFAVRNKYLTPVKNFHLDNKITRGEAAKLITKFFGRTVPEYSRFSLIDLGEHWSSNNAEYLFQNKIISGVGDTKEFLPNNKVTRSEFAKMISLAIDTWSK